MVLVNYSNLLLPCSSLLSSEWVEPDNSLDRCHFDIHQTISFCSQDHRNGFTGDSSLYRQKIVILPFG